MRKQDSASHCLWVLKKWHSVLWFCFVFVVFRLLLIFEYGSSPASLSDHMCTVPTETQERASEPLELELYTGGIHRYHVGLQTKSGSSARGASAPNH